MPLQIIDSNIEDVMSIYGMQLTYREGNLCSCLAENNGIPRLRCGCESGYRYKAPILFYGIKTNRKAKYDKSVGAYIYDSSAQLTIPRYYLNKIQPIWQLITHGDIISIPGKTMVRTDLLTKGTRDKIFNFDLKEILQVSRLETIFNLYDDYTIDLVTREIHWNPDSANIPDDGQSYSIKYICTQQYIVFEDEPFDRGGDGEDLPRKLQLVIRKYRETTEETNPLDDYNYSQQF
jgi:hypothetical protein